MYNNGSALKELADIPNLWEWVAQDPKLNLSSLIKLRESSAGRAFRKWFRETTDSDSSNIAKAYVDLIKGRSSINSFSIRAIRFLVTTTWGALEPISGTGIAAADNFLVEKFLRRTSPKFFLDRLAQVPH